MCHSTHLFAYFLHFYQKADFSLVLLHSRLDHIPSLPSSISRGPHGHVNETGGIPQAIGFNNNTSKTFVSWWCDNTKMELSPQYFCTLYAFGRWNSELLNLLLELLAYHLHELTMSSLDVSWLTILKQIRRSKSLLWYISSYCANSLVFAYHRLLFWKKKGGL